MAAAEVLLSHIDKKPQLTMKPRVSLEEERRVCYRYSNISYHRSVYVNGNLFQQKAWVYETVSIL